MKVLVVDDDEQRAAKLAEFLRSRLGSSEIDCVACTGRARSLLHAKYYDAVILDVVLPRRKGGAAAAAHSFELLSQIARESFLKKPEKVIGITAHNDDFDLFRLKFEEYCTVVVKAAGDSSEWRTRLCDALQYTANSQLSREVSKKSVAVLTIHGIRTYGSWQERLQRLIEERTDSVEFFAYKYGYFSSVALLVPFLRALEVRRLKDRLLPLSERIGSDKVFIFAHSFGTYLAAHALKKLLDISPGIEVCLVCSGSVLDENFDWGFARRASRVRVVNDCGSNDRILYLSKVFALGMGMAGKVGFNGFNDPRFVNRWFEGGHSHYFHGDSFMAEHWLPLLRDYGVRCVDHRSSPHPFQAALDGGVRWLGRLKIPAYVASGAYLALIVVTALV